MQKDIYKNTQKITRQSGAWAQVEDGKGGQLDGGRQALLAQGTPLGLPEWERNVDKRWQPAGGSAVQKKVDGRSTTGR